MKILVIIVINMDILCKSEKNIAWYFFQGRSASLDQNPILLQ